MNAQKYHDYVDDGGWDIQAIVPIVIFDAKLGVAGADEHADSDDEMTILRLKAGILKKDGGDGGGGGGVAIAVDTRREEH